MSIPAERIRAEIVGRGQVPTPILDASARDAVLVCHAQRAADVYLACRLAYVLRRLEGGIQSGDVVRDARIALGEYDLFLQLQSEAAA